MRDMPEGRRTWPLDENDLEKLGLDELLAELSDDMDSRDVNVMIYDSMQHLRARGTVMILEKGKIAR